MRKLFTLICFAILSSILSLGQNLEDNEAVRVYLDSVFENLDKSKVPTGYLKDYAFECVDMSYYDGAELTDSNYVDSELLEMILRTVKSSALFQKPFDNTTDMLYNLFRNEDMIPVPVALYKYNCIKETALDDGLIRYENDKVYDVYAENGTWKNPYETKYVLAFAPMVNESRIPSVQFDFCEIFSNENICDIDFDAGDGSGYRRIYENDVVRVAYPDNGEYELKLRIILYDGTTLVAHSAININVPNHRLQSDNSNGIDISDSVVYNGLTAHYKVKFKSSGVGLTKPIIIVEGFDPIMPGMNRFGYLSLEDFNFSESVTDSYDIVYVDFFNSEKDIFDNANLLKEVIRRINLLKHNSGSDEKNIIVGQSLGGVISRIALREMEIAGELHETKAYVSHDSPHLGANIPIGVLYALHDILSLYRNKIQSNWTLDFVTENIFYNIVEYIKYASYLLDSPAVKQLLVNYVSPLGVIVNSDHKAFLNQLSTLGFPRGDIGSPITNMAIPKSGSLDSYYKCDKILTLDEDISGIGASILYWFLGKDSLRFFRSLGSKCNLDIVLDIFPFEYSGCVVSNFELVYTKRILGRNKSFIIMSNTRFAPGEGPAYDVIPSSYYSLYALKYEFNMSSLDVVDRISFIPTASALCMKNGVNLSVEDYSRDFYKNPLSYPSETPFELVLSRNGQGFHEFTNSYDLKDEYSWILRNASTPPISLVGPVAPVDGDKYTMKSCEYPITWSISEDHIITTDNRIASIDENGVISIHSNGFVDVKAEVDFGYRVKTYTKRIMVGFPEHMLSYSTLTPYTVSVSTSGIELIDFIESANVKYHWGILYSGTNNTIWTEVIPEKSIPPLGNGEMVNKMSFDFSGHRDSMMAQVIFYVSSSAGESQRYTIQVVNEDYVSDGVVPVPPPIIIVNSNGEVLDTSSGEIVNVQTKATNSESYSLQIESDDIVVELNSYPSESAIIPALVSDERFQNLLYQIKPWGEEEVIIKTLSLYGDDGDFLWSVPLTIMYSDKF